MLNRTAEVDEENLYRLANCLNIAYSS